MLRVLGTDNTGESRRDYGKKESGSAAERSRAAGGIRGAE